jgi:two-component system CheB/CheR fusion protein
LLGCRRQKGTVRIEVWDTGVGIPDDKFQDIFEEYHQLDNAARNRNLGLGLGLSIVKRLGTLLDHPVSMRSKLGKGSVFSVEVRQSLAQIFGGQPAGHANVADASTILIVEDDSEVRDILKIGLNFEGYQVGVACDGASALRMIEDGELKPDLIISDYNLPNGMDGLQVVAKLRETLRKPVPVIILTGDISTQTLRDIAFQKFVHLNKPASLRQLTSAIRHLLLPKAGQMNTSASLSTDATTAPVVFIVDDDLQIREAIRSTLEEDGRRVEDYADGEAFLAAYCPGHQGCLLIDANLPGMSGIDLLNCLKDAGHDLPAIMITGHSDVPMAVQAMKAGASDFIEKPLRSGELLASVARALEQSRDSSKLAAWREGASRRIAHLTRRQHQIMDMVLAGNPSKNIAADLGISQRTVENHRASIMKKTGSRSLPALARLAVAASSNGAD